DRLLLTAIAVDDIDHVRNLLLRHELIHDIEGYLDMVRQQLAKDHPARRSLENLLHALALAIEGPRPPLDPRVQGDRLGLQGMFYLTDVGECHPLANVAVAH